MVTFLENKTQESLGNLEFCTGQIIKKDRDEACNMCLFSFLEIVQLEILHWICMGKTGWVFKCMSFEFSY